MSKLWREQVHFKSPNEEWHDITEILPYERLYKTLTQEQLQELLWNAKRLRWQALDLHRCGLQTLPPELGNLPDLRILDLGNGCWDDTDKFKDATENVFSALPDSVGQLSNLQRLYLSNTQLSALPDSIGNLANLRTLWLSNMSLTALPDFIGNLSNLQTLALLNIPIITLPESIRNLSNLQYLYLIDTAIIALPESIRNLSNLQYLDLRGTPLYKKIPPEIRGPLPQKVVRYILEMQSNAPKRYFNETKMVVVGQGSVGKSCLINRLIHKQYENQHSTEGIAIEPWDFPVADAGLDTQENYRLNVWDFGGQEIYHATHQFFLTHRTLYVLMWDALTEDEYGRRDYWMRTIRSFAGDSPVIIAVNKCDNDLGRYPQAEYAFLDKYPQILNRDRVFYISCRDNIGIDELRDYILSEAVKMPLMKTEWLEKWLNVRKELEMLSERENYIHYDKYLKICEKRGLKDEQEAQMLIQYLHDLGVIIHYHDDELLCGIVILSSEWGTDAVYKVLDEQQRTLKGRNGILLYEDLPKIWSDGKRYPRRMYPYLLKLMEKFQLAFQVDNPKLPNNTYLVAELLSENPMSHDWTPEGAEPLAFRYEYDFMPAGVMTRLIVSIHQYLEDIDGVKQCWRKGAYLVRGSAHAKLVLYDGIDRKYLDIRIIGENPRERSELLTVIREHVKGINSRFQKIEITEQVPCKCSVGCLHFFKYDTLLKAEAKRHLDVECPETLERVSVELLLDGIQKTVEDKRRKTEYGGMSLSIDHMEGNIIVDSPIGKNAEIHGTHEAATPEQSSDNTADNTEPTPTERAEIRNQNADTLLKILWIIITLLALLGAGYLLITHSMTVRELLEPFLGNLPG